MNTNVQRHKLLRRIGRAVLRWGGVSILLIFGAHLLLKTVVATPWAASRASQLLSELLGQPAAVSGLAISGATLVADGVVIADSASFGAGDMARCRTVRIAPDWREILAGRRRSFALIELRGLSVTVGRNSAGAWNFGELLRRLSAKRSPAETFIKRFVIEEASFTVAGRKVEGVSLTVTDLATKGSALSRLLLTCRDLNGNLYHLEGEARLGTAPAADLSLSAPALSLRGLDRLAGSRLPFATDKSTGRLSLALRYAGERFEARGEIGWAGVAVPVHEGTIPLRGTLSFSGSYDLKRDAAALDSVSMNANDLVHVRGCASAQRVRGECAFSGEVAGGEMDLNTLQGLLPESLRRGLAFRGTVIPGVFRFAGDRHSGLTDGSGTLFLHRGGLSRRGRPLLAGVEGEVSLNRERQDWLVHGRFSRRDKPAGTPLQELLLPFSARLSSRFRPLAADVGPFSATVAGIPMQGEVTLRLGLPEPLGVRLDAPRVALAALDEYLAPHNVRITEGTATASFRGKGRLPGELRGETRVEVAGLTGTAGGRPVSLGEAAVQGTVTLAAGKLSAAGTGRVAAGAADGKSIDGAFGYRVADREIALSDGSCTIGRTALRFATIRSAIPACRLSPGEKRLPLRLEFDGVDIRQGEIQAQGLAGSLAADLVSGAQGRRLEGAGKVVAPRLTLRDREVGALTSRIVFDKGGMAAAVSGKVLDGSLLATANVDPFAKLPSARFSLDLDRMQGASLAGMAVLGETVQPAGGTLETHLAGSYSRNDGLRCRLSAAGKEIVLAGKGGKTLLADGRLDLLGELADGNLTVRESALGAGPKLLLKFQGNVAHVTAPDRKGRLSLSLPAVPLDTVLASLANLLPRPLQEATAAGTVAGGADVGLDGRNVVLDGSATVADGALEVPSQKVSLTGISGTIPFSLDLAGGGAGRLPATAASRKDYARLLQDLRQANKEGELFRIGKIRFGAIECGATSISARAGNGLTEITSLKADLYGGQLLGNGFVGYRRGAVYGGDILVNDLSLKMFCDSYPAIKGYITGRLDGVMALHREGPGLPGVVGSIDLWTRVGRDEKMLVSKEFLQKLAGKKMKGIFFRNDRPYDRGEISATLEKGYLTFNLLNIEHTNFFGVKDLSVSVMPVQNRIAVDHLISAIREAAARGKAVKGGETPAEAPAETPPPTEFKWEEE